MNSLFTKVSLAMALGATALTAAAPADAQRYNGGYRNHDGTGTAIVAGIAGLAIGAALASSNNRRDGYYERGGYYDQRGYYADRGYDRDRRYYHHRHHHDGDRDYRGGYDRDGGSDRNGYDRNDGYSRGYGY